MINQSNNQINQSTAPISSKRQLIYEDPCRTELQWCRGDCHLRSPARNQVREKWVATWTWLELHCSQESPMSFEWVPHTQNLINGMKQSVLMMLFFRIALRGNQNSIHRMHVEPEVFEYQLKICLSFYLFTGSWPWKHGNSTRFPKKSHYNPSGNTSN